MAEYHAKHKIKAPTYELEYIEHVSKIVLDKRVLGKTFRANCIKCGMPVTYKIIGYVDEKTKEGSP